ncbi:MAG: universal stress protein [Alphaproteobacteria bacterium]|nr:universal stress protein [Alphaproteobacteria bacterium]
MTKKILCSTDGTDHSEHAVQLAAELAAKLGAGLAICAVNVARGGARGPLIYSWDDAEVKKILDGAAAIARKAGASKVEEVALRSREAAAAIVQYAEENGFDHIVVGTGDKRGVSRLVLGSVAADVSGRAHCSVTVAR